MVRASLIVKDLVCFGWVLLETFWGRCEVLVCGKSVPPNMSTKRVQNRHHHNRNTLAMRKGTAAICATAMLLVVLLLVLVLMVVLVLVLVLVVVLILLVPLNITST